MSSAGTPGRKPFWFIHGDALAVYQRCGSGGSFKFTHSVLRNDNGKPLPAALTWRQHLQGAATASRVPGLYQVLCAAMASCGFHCCTEHAALWKSYDFAPHLPFAGLADGRCFLRGRHILSGLRPDTWRVAGASVQIACFHARTAPPAGILTDHWRMQSLCRQMGNAKAP